jgi:hypothetical protein
VITAVLCECSGVPNDADARQLLGINTNARSRSHFYDVRQVDIAVPQNGPVWRFISLFSLSIDTKFTCIDIKPFHLHLMHESNAYLFY